MKKIEFGEILNIYEYEKVREQKRREIIEIKKKRRLFVGDLVHLVFENRDTVWFQIQEMIRVERMVRDEEIQQEIDIYNELIPEKNQLSITMFIEIPNEQERKRLLPQLVGIHDHLWFHIGNKHSIRAEADEKSERDYQHGKAAVVHFFKLNLTPEQVKDFAELPVRVEINHPNYKAMVEMPEEVKAELVKDLQSE